MGSTNPYKKSALIAMYMARDLFLAEPGDRIPTISEYTQNFGVSRGIVQNALEELTASGSITTEKRGVLGTFLIQADREKLCSRTGWGSCSGAMPIPMTPYFVSLATAVFDVLAEAPQKFNFFYMSGAAKRVQALREGKCDFAVLSKGAAERSVQEYGELAVCTELTGTHYDAPYLLCFMDPEKSRVEDGMRMGVDPVCLDQMHLTGLLCRDKKVEIVEFPFVGFRDIISSGRIDCTLFRDGSWNNDWQKLKIRTVPLREIPELAAVDTQTPVVLVRRDNYGIDRLLNKHLNAAAIAHIQQQVLDGHRGMKFY
jgi:hypothetical protein